MDNFNAWVIVRHSDPIHDRLCRCRRCKPPLVGHASDALLRVRVGTAGLGFVGVAFIAARALGFL